MLMGLMVVAAGLMGLGPNIVRAEILAYHTGNPFGIVTFPADYDVCVRFAPPSTGANYRINTVRFDSRGLNPGGVFPAGTRVAIRVWDASGEPLTTSPEFDLSGEPAGPAIRQFSVDWTNLVVRGEFYAGVEQRGTPFTFAVRFDSPTNNHFGRSYEYDASIGILWTYQEDLMIEADVTLLLAPPTLTTLPVASNQFRFSFNAESKLPYTVESCGTFPASNWIVLTNIPTLPAATTFVIADPLTTSNRCYRVRLPQP